MSNKEITPAFTHPQVGHTVKVMGAKLSGKLVHISVPLGFVIHPHGPVTTYITGQREYGSWIRLTDLTVIA